MIKNCNKTRQAQHGSGPCRRCHVAGAVNGGGGAGGAKAGQGSMWTALGAGRGRMEEGLRWDGVKAGCGRVWQGDQKQHGISGGVQGWAAMIPAASRQIDEWARNLFWLAGWSKTWASSWGGGGQD